jgi:exportin-2 (importin alpha re-exporter)
MMLLVNINSDFDYFLNLMSIYLEFVPYVLQILGFLLESYRSGSTPVPDAYRILFSSILTPAFWDRSGNIPALSGLLQAYIEKAGESIVLEKLVS